MERWSVVADFFGVGLQSPRGVGEFEDVGPYPVGEIEFWLPGGRLLEVCGSGACELLDDEVRHARAAELLPHNVIEDCAGPDGVQKVSIGGTPGKARGNFCPTAETGSTQGTKVRESLDRAMSRQPMSQFRSQSVLQSVGDIGSSTQ